MALAYFITFSTYGTWLPGSAKGKGSVDREHNEYGTPFVEPDPQRERWARVAMTQPAFVMSPQEREIVCQAFVELAKERGWQLWAAACTEQPCACGAQRGRQPGPHYERLEGACLQESE
ncbi:MAG: hypothetical protein JNJ77_14125 [Planctomycetia bacterium]|nr:hypothetical protein [Planctomycetia bacterium]